MKEISFSKEQESAINYFIKNYRKKRIVSICGYAGTGKSEIAKEISRRLRIPPHKVAYCAYTGAAALVLKKKGVRSCTIHHLIYNTRHDAETDRYFIKLKEKLDNDYELIIVDEASFIDNDIVYDLLSFNIPLLILGDPGQLPPVKGNLNDYILSPDIMLTEIFRQDEGSDIINFSSKLRKGDYDFTHFSDEVKCIPSSYVDVKTYLCADQILCYTNVIKDRINSQVRDYLGFDQRIPMVGDKLVCTKNDWEKLPINSDYTYELVNGMTGFIEEIKSVTGSEKNSHMDCIFALEFNRDIKYRVEIDLNNFLGYKPYVPKVKYGVNKNIIVSGRNTFEFGYAMTVHKSQGSEWDKVLVVSKGAFGDKKKLYYTAATRAAKCLVWVT